MAKAGNDWYGAENFPMTEEEGTWGWFIKEAINCNRMALERKLTTEMSAKGDE